MWPSIPAITLVYHTLKTSYREATGFELFAIVLNVRVDQYHFRPHFALEILEWCAVKVGSSKDFCYGFAAQDRRPCIWHWSGKGELQISQADKLRAIVAAKLKIHQPAQKSFQKRFLKNRCLGQLSLRGYPIDCIFSVPFRILFLLTVDTCTNPATPTNGVKTPSGSTFQFGDVIQYSCNAGFRLVGEGTLACLAGGRVNSSTNMTCQNIDECVESHPCGRDAFCNDTHGSYLCSCMAGFTGNGLICHGRVNSEEPALLHTHQVMSFLRQDPSLDLRFWSCFTFAWYRKSRVASSVKTA